MTTKLPVRITLRRAVLGCLIPVVVLFCGLSGLALSTASFHYGGPNYMWVRVGAAWAGVMNDDYCRDGYDHDSIFLAVEWPGRPQPFFYALPIARRAKCL